MRTMTTEQLADLKFPPAPGEDAETRKRRFRSAAVWARRRGLVPAPGRADNGQRLWPEDAVLAELAVPDRPGNRTSGADRKGGRRKSPVPLDIVCHGDTE